MPAIDRHFKRYLYLCLGILVLAFTVDLFGYLKLCSSGVCNEGSWMLGTAASVAVFVFPALLVHYFVPIKIKGHLLAIPLCFVFWVGWIILISLLNGAEFRPTVVSLAGLYLLYRAASGRSSSVPA